MRPRQRPTIPAPGRVDRGTDRAHRQIGGRDHVGQPRRRRDAHRHGLHHFVRRADRHQLSRGGRGPARARANWPTGAGSTRRPYTPPIASWTWPSCASTPRTCPRSSWETPTRSSKGRRVVALGNPAGLRHSVVSGVVSAVREMDGRPMIQVAIPDRAGQQRRAAGRPGRARAGHSDDEVAGDAQPGLCRVDQSAQAAVGKAQSDSDVALADDRCARPARVAAGVRGAVGGNGPAASRSKGPGAASAARSLCLWQMDVPETPLEIAVTVQLDDESRRRRPGVLHRRRRPAFRLLSHRRAICG